MQFEPITEYICVVSRCGLSLLMLLFEGGREDDFLLVTGRRSRRRLGFIPSA